MTATIYNMRDYTSSKPVTRRNETDASLFSNTASVSSTPQIKEGSPTNLNITIDVNLRQPDFNEREYLGTIDASRLYGRSSEAGASNMSAALIETCSAAIETLESCMNALAEEDIIQSDLDYMAIQRNIRSLQEYLELSDGVGLVITQLQKFVVSDFTALDFTPLSSEVKRALNALRTRPNMSFGHAMEIADALDSALGSIDIPGHEQIFDLLVRDLRDGGAAVTTLPTSPQLNLE
jgi:hypothetical protein